MILCVVDDLLFSVKISTAAKALNVNVQFERSALNVLPRIRAERPTLVIFDLNSMKLRPLETIAAMKGDPELQTIRTLGYVSHVQSEVIEAAREAGTDEILARSAFSDRLATILTSS
jgi:PleD family two-component response regulator